MPLRITRQDPTLTLPMGMNPSRLTQGMMHPAAGQGLDPGLLVRMGQPARLVVSDQALDTARPGAQRAFRFDVGSSASRIMPYGSNLAPRRLELADRAYRKTEAPCGQQAAVALGSRYLGYPR